MNASGGTPGARAGAAEHYVWGDGCDGWHLVRAPELSVIQERMPPGTAEVRHRHRRARQCFYVLAGELRLEVEGETTTLRAGDALEIAPGRAHEVRNDGGDDGGSGDAWFLVMSAPPARDDREPAPR